ncbi:MAG: cytochrome-c peroxidase, partial [Burkholderiales bacterium]
MKRFESAFLVVFGLAALAAAAEKADPAKPPLGLPPLVVPEGNPQTPEKVALGQKLFEDKRFSSTGGVACASCHDAKKAFTDSPLATSEGILVKGKALTGT